ncbi:hypothetical protein D3C78_910660 [compost metagenome]
MVVIHFQQVVDFVIVDLHIFRIAVILHVGGADDREFVIPWDHEDDTMVFVLQNIGLWLIVYTRYHDVAAFDQTDAIRGFQLQTIVEEVFHPWTGGVHQALGAPGKGFATVDVDRFHHPQAVFTPCTGHFGACAHFATALFHFLGIEYHQASIVDPAVRIFETALQFRLQHRFWSKAQTLAAWQTGAFTQVIVQEQADTDHPGWAQVRLMRQTETHWEGDVWRQSQ